MEKKQIQTGTAKIAACTRNASPKTRTSLIIGISPGRFSGRGPNRPAIHAAGATVWPNATCHRFKGFVESSGIRETKTNSSMIAPAKIDSSARPIETILPFD